jgi:hypothetical protein
MEFSLPQSDMDIPLLIHSGRLQPSHDTTKIPFQDFAQLDQTLYNFQATDPITPSSASLGQRFGDPAFCSNCSSLDMDVEFSSSSASSTQSLDNFPFDYRLDYGQTFSDVSMNSHDLSLMDLSFGAIGGDQISTEGVLQPGSDTSPPQEYVHLARHVHDNCVASFY